MMRLLGCLPEDLLHGVSPDHASEQTSFARAHDYQVISLECCSMVIERATPPRPVRLSCIIRNALQFDEAGDVL